MKKLFLQNVQPIAGDGGGGGGGGGGSPDIFEVAGSVDCSRQSPATLAGVSESAEADAQAAAALVQLSCGITDSVRQALVLSRCSSTDSLTPAESSNDSQPLEQQQQLQLHLLQMPMPNESPAKGKRARVKGAAGGYVPSYMDLSNGPEPCIVCNDAATGYHYRCMTCEGCKGFFRRTVQKNLQYTCKWNGDCQVDKNTRNHCQQCRFQKCLAVGMAADLVLSEKQRVAKRRLIEENRQRRTAEIKKLKRQVDDDGAEPPIEDSNTVETVSAAFETAWRPRDESKQSIKQEPSVEADENPGSYGSLARLMSRAVSRVIEFAREVPGFAELCDDDQRLLLKSSCMEILCLRVACRYDKSSESLTLSNGAVVTKETVKVGRLGEFVEPLLELAVGLSRLDLDSREVALLAGVLLMQSDRLGLRQPERIEAGQDAILRAFKRYVNGRRGGRGVDWAKILMKVTDLRTIVTRQGDGILTTRLDDGGNEMPLLFMHIFCDLDAPGDAQRL